MEVRNPVDGTVVGTVANQAPEVVADTARALRRHQPAWEALGPDGRATWLRRYRDWLLDNAERIADVVAAESGKPRAEAVVEVPAICEVLNYYADNAATFLADERVKPSGVLSLAKKLTLVRQPYQLVGVITPWNFPVITPGFDVVPALLAGAAVLLKPSEVTPLSALEMARGWREIGAPEVFAVVTGAGDTGQALVDNVDYVQFTGSTRTGQRVAHRAVDRMIPYSLELGGKDPAIVLADADLDRAVPGIAWGALFNAGQACVSVERVYVEAPIYDEFVARLTEVVGKLRQGADAGGFTVDVGAMTTEAQRDIVVRHVDDALTRGAKATVGGKPTGPGLFLEPTVLIDVDHSMSCMREETFGPTIPVVKVADAAEAVRLANDSAYGLSATVWTRDIARGVQIARRLEAGAVNINDAAANLFATTLPHGGWKSSGTGARLGGAHGLRKYTRAKAITVPRVSALKREPLWFPYTARRIRFVQKAFQFIAAHDVRRWVRL
ncbi:aldehyde dehydrogenase family protein [Mycobacterium eburneum]|nr:aldehyde dehydrogenase family protein [Mycobacterium eburneum]